MRGTRIGDSMSTGIVSVVPDVSVARAREVARKRNVRHLLVTSNHDLVGVACLCDFAPAADATPVAKHMASPVVTISPDATLEFAAEVMRTRRVGCLPVVNGELLGIITRGDLRRLGFADHELGALRCVVCGWWHNVVASFGTPEVGLCLFCRERAVPPDEDIELGGSG